MRSLARRGGSALGRPRATSCQRLGYGRVLGSDFVFGLVVLPASFALTYAGAAYGARRGGTPEASEQLSMRYALAGNVLGMLVSLVPALFAQRAVLRSRGCSNPGFGRVAGYGATKLATFTALRAAGDAVAGPVGGAIASLAGAFTLPFLGKAIVTQ